jgi:hypothetical protein
MSTMKGGNFGLNGTDLDKGNILKPIFDTLTEELFLSRCEVMRQGTVLKDTTPIIFNKPEVIPE